MIMLPVCLLLFAQVQFVRYQSNLITWVQRLAVTAYMALLWVRWLLIVTPRGQSGEWWKWFVQWRGVRRKATGP